MGVQNSKMAKWLIRNRRKAGEKVREKEAKKAEEEKEREIQEEATLKNDT